MGDRWSPNCPQVIRRDGLCCRCPGPWSILGSLKADTHGGGSCSLPEILMSNDYIELGSQASSFFLDTEGRRWCLGSRDGRKRARRRGGERRAAARWQSSSFYFLVPGAGWQRLSLTDSGQEARMRAKGKGKVGLFPSQLWLSLPLLPPLS